MQAKTITEHELVRLCMEELCKKAGFAAAGNLVQRDLQFLCDSIESKTGVLISLSTMRRLLNGQFSRLPQIATLDALALFLGYPNWQGFKLDKSPSAIKDEASSRPDAARRRRFARPRLLLIGGFLLLAIPAFLAIVKSGKPGLVNIEKAQFTAVKTTSNDLPNTVVFRYNIDSVDADSFFIQQSWDKNRRVRIDKHSHTLTDIYYEPGYHKAKLIANDVIIKTVDVSIPTDRWFFYAKETTPPGLPRYIPAAKGISNGLLRLTPNDLLNTGIDPQKENRFLQVYFPSAFNNSSDNFVLKFRIRVNQLNNTSCPYFMSEIFCQNYFMYFINMPKGCTSELRAQFGENYLNGKTNDFSAMGIDVTAWQSIELTVKNKKASLRINGVETFSAAYNQSCGLITGLGFISNGLSEVDFVELKTIDGKTIYSNDFESPRETEK